MQLFLFKVKRTKSSQPRFGWGNFGRFLGVLDFFKGSPLWNNENKSCLNDMKFWEVSGNPKNKQILKVTALYLMWNPGICQDAPSCGQDNLVLIMASAIGLWWILSKEKNRTNQKVMSEFSILVFHVNCYINIIIGIFDDKIYNVLIFRYALRNIWSLIVFFLLYNN